MSLISVLLLYEVDITGALYRGASIMFFCVRIVQHGFDKRIH
nr:MAG TPA: hypothetical protein [Caudoviricetes sp.]